MARTTQQCKTANRGEWSEVYVFFHLLGDPCLHPCDADLNPQGDGLLLPVAAIQRGEDELKRPLVYTYQGDESRRWNMRAGEQDLPASIPADVGRGEAQNLLRTLLSSKHQAGDSPSKGITCPEADAFLQRLGNATRKAASSQKEDIVLTLDDVRAGRARKPQCGFSIKSYLGGAPTLLNASKDNTNLLFCVEGLAEREMQPINARQLNQRIPAILSQGGTLHLARFCGEQFHQNLLFIDTSMPQILGELLLLHYAENINGIADATERLSERNPLNLPRTDLYSYKVKKLLEAVSLGMTPARPWCGTENANGGFIIVTPTGEIVSYHLYERNQFLEYVYHGTRFEHPDTRRHQYGTLFCEQGQMFIKLALQIRFKERSPARVRRAPSA